MSVVIPSNQRNDSSKTTENTSALPCRICGKPVPVLTANTDDEGKAVHEECYTFKVASHQPSQDGHEQLIRPWKVIAEEVSREQDPVKLNKLARELGKAMDAQAKGKSKIDGSSK